ncbi:hypothetical protein CV102_24540 [Natronococcus pandeyae]|uniref:Uncharacterized protein n=1 Tax=Natronococcus pandeyae TaxID=2055836 RepID=A0A8J8TMW3_9EURY|nr:hypothetical protein [Natronococcus pandeyae]TYL36021.1 hypothetical protein CV102_24540 [Natronococcus pandeyae]
MNTSSLTSRVDTSRIALLLNVALVFTGSVLALLGMLDLWSGVFVVCLGLVGIYVSLIGRAEDTDSN